MDLLLISIHYSDPFWIALAFLCGFLAKKLGMPSLVGFIAAGFMLNALGVQGGEFLNSVADLGITMLLFSIGLKLRLNALARPEVWGVASIHMMLVTLLMAGFLLLLSYTQLPLLTDINASSALLIGFALCFSSTVFAVKILDELGASQAMHGRIAIGILVMQDIAAVVFIAASMGKLPQAYAIGLFALIPLRFVLYRILDQVEHGELLILFGIVCALLGADIFELVGIKGDVGALVFGMLLAPHIKAVELAKSLLGFKELFLVGFFVSVGMTALPGIAEILVALTFLLLIPLKQAIFFILFSWFNLRSSSAWRTSFNLANYSEFGLIVGAIAISNGWLDNSWLAVFALMMSLSFVVSSQTLKVRDSLYLSWKPRLNRFQRAKRLHGEENLSLKGIKMVIFGMGRRGVAVYSALTDEYGYALLGVDVSQDKVDRYSQAGKAIVCGDATQPDFWNRAPNLIDDLEWVVLTLPTHQANISAATQIRKMGFKGKMAATTSYADEKEKLESLGVHYTFNVFTEAGYGFANELKKMN